jgi:hypothetical protein
MKEPTLLVAIAATMLAEGSYGQNVEMCSFCPDGITAGVDYVVQTNTSTTGEDLTCGGFVRVASMYTADDVMCTPVKVAENVCCPGPTIVNPSMDDDTPPAPDGSFTTSSFVDTDLLSLSDRFNPGDAVDGYDYPNATFVSLDPTPFPSPAADSRGGAGDADVNPNATFVSLDPTPFPSLAADSLGGTGGDGDVNPNATFVSLDPTPFPSLAADSLGGTGGDWDVIGKSGKESGSIIASTSGMNVNGKASKSGTHNVALSNLQKMEYQDLNGAVEQQAVNCFMASSFLLATLTAWYLM